MSKLKYVAWDPDAASAAVAALNRAASQLRTSTEERQRVAQVAVQEWKGRHREEFDQYPHRAVLEAGDLAESYKRRAMAIERSNQQAIDLNRKREREHDEQERRNKHPRAI